MWRLRHRGGLGTGLPVFCGELVLEIFQVCCGDVVFQVVPGQVCVYDAVGGRDGSLAVGGAVVDLLLGAGGSGDDGAGWGFGSFGLPLNLRHRRRAVSGPLRPVRTGHALLCHKNHRGYFATAAAKLASDSTIPTGAAQPEQMRNGKTELIDRQFR